MASWCECGKLKDDKFSICRSCMDYTYSTSTRSMERKQAIISECGKFRYVLRRPTKVPLRWVKPCLFIMLNPSIADDKIDDPTIRKCIKFAEREGCTGLTVVNLFALRATNPKELMSATHSHRENQDFIFNEIWNHRPGLVILAWGSHESVKFAPTVWLETQLVGAGVQPKCFKINKDGNPKHPLYVRDDQPLINYTWGNIPDTKEQDNGQ